MIYSVTLSLRGNNTAKVIHLCPALRITAFIMLAAWTLNANPLAQPQALGDSGHQRNTTDRQRPPAEDRKDKAQQKRHRAGVETDSANPTAEQESTPAQGLSSKSDSEKQQSSEPANDERKGEWVIAPIPVRSPALGAGLEWAVGYVSPFSKQDKRSPPSLVGVGGLFTDNGSRGIGLGARLYLKEDKYRIALAGGHASINAELFGVGKVAGDRGVFLPVNAKGSGFFTESLFRLRKGIYLGARFQYRNLKLSLDRQNSDLPPDTETNPPSDIAPIIDSIREDLFRQRTIALGPRFQWDTRDNTFYPTRGVFLDSGIDLFAQAIGSEFTYQYYKVAFNKYAGFGEHQVLAYRAMGCAAAGSRVPIYDLCLFGFQNDLRGYSAGRFQDRRMFATQAEYRLRVPKTGFLGRFGLVAFGGVGGIGSKFTDINLSDMLPSGGGGIRFRLTKKNPINFRIDYGVGKTGGALSIGVGEAF